MGKSEKQSGGSLEWLMFLFLISGFAALIYQVVWQRVLFTLFGVNIESITIIVSVFMFGLGVGSLVGGVLSARFPRHLPQLFLVCEVIIGLFGLVSLPLMKAVGQATLHSSLVVMGLVSYALLCVPTIFMGATLPILVAHLHQHWRHVGQSVGKLYFINTVGSAIACFLTVDLLFVVAGLQAAVFTAAFCNFAVGVLMYRYVTRRHAVIEEAEETEGRRDGETEGRRDGETEGQRDRGTEGGITPPLEPSTARGEGSQRRGRFFLVLFLSAAVGFISLSQEILWFRVLSYAAADTPDVFAHVLGFLLFGIAYGARDARRWYERGSTLTCLAAVLAGSAVVFYFSIPAVGHVLTFSRAIGMGFAYATVMAVAFLVGSIFPALCQHGIDSEAAVGLALSWIYFANILGSTAGPLVTGFLLLNDCTLQELALYLSVGTLALAGLVALAAPLSLWTRLLGTAGLAVVALVLWAVHDPAYALLLERLHYKEEFAQFAPYKYVIQNRNGIVAVAPANDDVFGGGVYDGAFNLEPVRNSNGITRVYMIAALHSDPQDVLEIGLSSGSSARVIASHDRVQRFTVIEINPAYEELIRHYPDWAVLFEDPKVTIVYDDGRRWLNRNPDRKFDLIFSNSIHHVRGHATNLLSEEFMRLCKAHLKDGGVLYFNTTHSEDVVFTGAQVFRYATLVLVDNDPESVHAGFLALSDRPFDMPPDERRRNLLRFRLHGGRPVFGDDSPDMRKALDYLVNYDTSDVAARYRSDTRLWCITDDNMATEFKRKYDKWLPRPLFGAR